MPTIIVKTGESPPKELQLPDQRFTYVVHQQGIRVDVPDFVQINGANTLKTCMDLTQKQWEHISTGPLFQELFYTVFPKDREKNFGEVVIPKDVNNLKEGDPGVAHISGMIIMMCETAFEVIDGKRKELKIFFRNPESHLHPAAQQTIIGMLTKFQAMFTPPKENEPTSNID
jgi:predicted ATPase